MTAVRTILRWLPAAAAPVLAVSVGGCLPVAVAGASQGINYTFTQTAYRSFTNSRAQVHGACVQTLAKMQIAKINDDKTDESIRIEGKTKELKIYIWIKSVTPRVTKVSVNAKKNFLVKDKTVAVEILMQMARILGAP